MGLFSFLLVKKKGITDTFCTLVADLVFFYPRKGIYELLVVNEFRCHSVDDAFDLGALDAMDNQGGQIFDVDPRHGLSALAHAAARPKEEGIVNLLDHSTATPQNHAYKKVRKKNNSAVHYMISLSLPGPL